MKSRNQGIALLYCNTLISMISGLYLSSFLLRTLGDTEYGVYQTIAAFANYLVLLEFGLGTVMTRNISVCRSRHASKEELEKNINTLWAINNVLALAIAVLSLGFYLSIDWLYQKSLNDMQLLEAKRIFLLVVLYLILSFYAQTFRGIALGFERYGFSAKQNLARTVLRVVLLTVGIYLYPSSLVIAIVDAVLEIGFFIHAYGYCSKRLELHFKINDFDKQVFKKSFPLCMAIFLQAIVNQANNNVDKFLIGIFISPEMVSLYSVALYVYTVYSSVSVIPLSMYAPMVAREIGSGITNEELSIKLVPAVRLNAVVSGGILFGLFAVGRQFIHIVYGEQYHQAWIMALMLCAVSYLHLLTSILLNVLDVKNKRLVASNILLVTTAANVILTLVWMPRWGLYGAVTATSLCILLGQVILMGIYYTKILHISILYLYREGTRGILLFQILGSVIALILGRYIQNQWVSFLTCGVVYVLIFVAGFLACDKNIRRTVKAFLSGKHNQQ